MPLNPGSSAQTVGKNISELMKNEVWKFENSKEDLINKPEEIRNKIVSGRVEKTLKTKVLLEQPFVRDSNITVEEYIKQTIAILGENIKVRRFVRYVLGELDNI
jgi:elongation factor Ts